MTDNQKITNFRNVPIKVCDEILNTEARVAVKESWLGSDGSQYTRYVHAPYEQGGIQWGSQTVIRTFPKTSLWNRLRNFVEDAYWSARDWWTGP